MRLAKLLWGVPIPSGAGTFERDGYVACLCVPLVFGFALLQCFDIALMRDPGNVQLVVAVKSSLAAVVITTAIAFELWQLLLERSPHAAAIALGGAVMTGFVALAVCVRHPALSHGIVLLVVVRMVILIARRGIARTAVPLLAGGAVGYWTFLLSFVDGYKTPWINEAIRSGTVHVDLLFQAGIVNMLSGYGIGSLGVDGLTPFPYHFASHHIVKVLCALLGVGGIQFYSVIFPLLFCPMFILFLYFFSVAFRNFLAGEVWGDNATLEFAGAWYWGVFAIIFIGVVPAALRRALGVWDNVFHSESFGVAVLFSYLAGIWVFGFLQRGRNANLPWFLWPVVVCYLAVLCCLKISVGLVIGGLAAYLLVRLRLAPRQRIAGLIAVALPLAYGLWSTRAPTVGSESGPGLVEMIKPFAFLRDTVAPDLYWASFAVFFGPLVVFAALRIILSGQGGRVSLWARVASSSLLDVELAVVVTIVSILPGMLLSVPQGSTNFFAEVSYWWVQPMLAVAAATALAGFAGRRAVPMPGSIRADEKQVKF